MIVTRLECPESGTVLQGRFSLGWVGRLTPEQIDFVGLLLKYRNNLQKLASELGVAYNTARSRLDDIVEAIGGVSEPDSDPHRQEVLSQLADRKISFEEAMAQLKRD
ncbi:MAG: DUF2089 domain-containing protein [Actinobacteria bacterium]|nr:DUF2089 domain-containing protein [Actinomycetota bacterium]